MNHIATTAPKTLKRPRVRTLGELMEADNKPRELLLGRWMKEAHLCMVYAPTGVGKSFFALSCALAIAGGGEVFGWKAPKPRRVLLVDGEMDREDITERARGLIPAIGGADPKAVKDNLRVLAYQDQEPETWFPKITDPEGQDYTAKVAKDHGASVVVLDNLSTLARVEDENAAHAIDPVIDLLMKLKRHGLAVVVIHHARKNGGGGEGSYRGSQKIGVTFQTIIRLNHPDNVPSHDGVAFDLTFEKMRELRTAETEDFRATLPTNGSDDPTARHWRLEVRGDARLRRLVANVKSLKYATQEALARSLDVSTGTLHHLKTTVLSQGLMKVAEWNQCMRNARQLADEARGVRIEKDDGAPF
jgi:hypothetical protein